MRAPKNGAAFATETEPVSYEQEALFTIFEGSRMSASQNARLVCDVSEALVAEAVQKSFDEIVRRHPILRTIYLRHPGGVSQRVLKDVGCDFEVVDAGIDTDVLEARIAEVAGQPFDLEYGPVFRVRMFLRGEFGCSILMCIHQIAADSASLRILLRDFEAIYASHLTGTTPHTSLVQTSYLSYARPQRTLTFESVKSSLEFWSSRLPGQETTLDLPLDRSRPAEFHGNRVELRFEASEQLTRRVLSLAENLRSTVSSVYLTAWAILLSRYGATENVPIAMGKTCRDNPWLKDVVGNFSNQVVITAGCVPEMTFEQLLGQVSLTAQMAHEHRKLPFAYLLAEFGIEPRPGRAPVCDTYFAWEEPTQIIGQFAGAPFEAVTSIPPAHGDYDLGLRVYGYERRASFSLAYRQDIFDPSSIERMARHFVRLIDRIADNPGSCVGELDIMTDDERSLILGSWAGVASEFPARSLHELFAAQAIRQPEAEALVFDGHRLSYEELDRRSNRIANFLVNRGISSDAPVGIFMRSSVDMVVSIVAILKAGGFYCPIDPAYPADRIDFMVRDMGARLVLAHEHQNPELPAGVELVHIDDPESPIASTGYESVLVSTAPESPAALIYTSGSTGKPKGTLIPHRAVVRSIRNTNYLRVTPADRIGQAMSPSFDVCILEVWSALANGAALIGLPRETILAPAEMERTLRAERLSVLWIPTAYLHQIGRETPGILKGVRVVLFGGERAESEPVRRILQHGPPGELINCYGPAEAGIIASFHRILSLSDCGAPIPIGRPVKNVRMYVVDQQMHPAPIGVPGEIWIGGEIGCGYRNRPELNREKFVPDTFSGLPGGRLYRTGDLGRLNGSGEFEFLGRADQQVKLRGYRIELAEVQMAVGSHPDVRQAIAMVREDHPGARRLVVYVTLRRELSRAQEALREHAASRLPHYMVPAAIIPLESIPLTANGKIDLPMLVAYGFPTQAASYEKPGTDLEKAMAGIWKELLGLDRVAANDNFFTAGGDSLTGMRLIVAVRDFFGIDLPLRCLFEAADLRSFCEELHSYEQQPGQLERLARIIEEVEQTGAEEMKAGTER